MAPHSVLPVYVQRALAAGRTPLPTRRPAATTPAASSTAKTNSGPTRPTNRRRQPPARHNADRVLSGRILKAADRLELRPGCRACRHAKGGETACWIAPSVNKGKCAKCAINKVTCAWDADPAAVLVDPANPGTAPVPAAEVLNTRNRRGSKGTTSSGATTEAPVEAAGLTQGLNEGEMEAIAGLMSMAG